MNNPVIIKGNKWGIKLIIHEEATTDDVIKALRLKLQKTKGYYKNIKPIIVTFEGKFITEDEKEVILDTLRQIGLNIKNESHDKTTLIPESVPDASQKDGLFFIGNLKAGESIDAADSIVIIGNIETGASVYSEGNIVIIGELNGYAESGYKGRNDTFVYSLSSGGNN